MTTTLVIQIPCYNEAQILPQALADLPKTIPGVDRIIVLVINDGSSDDTERVALENGADYVLRQRKNRGLARGFMAGLQTALALGADIIVNTDADNQYPGRYIPDLVAPLLAKQADIVIGNRQPAQNQHFSFIKGQLEEFGSYVIRLLSKTDAPDAPSGFRAFSRYAALRTHVYNSYSYTLETLIRAGREQMRIQHLPIETNPSYRPSRLHQGILNFIWRQGGVILRSYVLYQPLRTFLTAGIPFVALGLLFILRFVYLYLIGDSGVGRYIQSVSIGGTLLIFGLLLCTLGLIGDAIRANRQTMEEILIHLRDTAKLPPDGNEYLGSTLLTNETKYGHKPG
jgi:glycosyltransferase involved in cell wall biosynthesis